jgi:hypothetical protein
MLQHYGPEAIEFLLQERRMVIKYLPSELEYMRDVFKIAAQTMLDTKKLLKGETYAAYVDDLDSFGPYGMRVCRLYDNKAR